MNALLRLYPRAWRDRYGDEMSALLEDRRPGPFDWLDLFVGAADAHLNRRGLGGNSMQGKGIPMSARIGGGGALLGGSLFLLAFAIGAAARETAGNVVITLFLVASVAMLVGLAGLSAFQSRRHPVLAGASFVLPAIGVVLLVGGFVANAFIGDRPIVGDLTPWVLWALGTVLAMIGCVVFGIVTLATAAQSRVSPGLLIAGTLLIVVAASGLTPIQEPVLAAGTIAFGLSWVLFGLESLRSESRPVAARAI